MARAEPQSRRGKYVDGFFLMKTSGLILDAANSQEPLPKLSFKSEEWALRLRGSARA